MTLSNIVLMWVAEGVIPTSGTPFDGPHAQRLGFEVSSHPTLRSAVDNAMRDRNIKKSAQKLPFIKVHTGEGVAIFNDQGIFALDEELP